MLWIPVERVIGPGDPGLAHDPFHLVPLVPAVLTSFIFTATATLVYDRDVSAIPPWAVLAAWLAIAVLPYVPLAVLRLNPGDIALLRTPIPPSRVNVRLLVLVWILLLLATAFWVDYWFGFHGRFARTPLFKCAWWACQGEITGLILITFQVIGSFMAAWFIAKFLAQPTNTVPAKTPAPSARPGVGDEATVTSPD